MAEGTIRPHFESTIRTRSGEKRTISWNTTLQRDADRASVGIVTIGEDVTERRRAHDALREREEHFRSMIEYGSDVICVLAPDGTSIYESPSVERVLGWKPEELIGSENFAFRHPDDAERADRHVAQILAGEDTKPIQLRLRHRDGSWRTVESNGRMGERDGRTVVILNYRDITERLQHEEQLLHAQKL